MIPIQSAVIARAKHTPARFVEIEPRRGVRRGDAMRKLREQDAEAQPQRPRDVAHLTRSKPHPTGHCTKPSPSALAMWPI